LGFLVAADTCASTEHIEAASATTARSISPAATPARPHNLPPPAPDGSRCAKIHPGGADAVKNSVAPVLIALCALPTFAQCGNNSSHQYVVVNVNLERAGHLSSAQQAPVRSRVIGRCFDSSDTIQLTQRVLDTYQNFGYFRATVLDPSIQIIDDTRYPKPASVTFDVDEGYS
jgi:hemolysin activation/secretion protein